MVDTRTRLGARQRLGHCGSGGGRRAALGADQHGFGRRGPPGTGKTETSLNLIANISAVRHEAVGIVPFGNATVDNVCGKLAEAWERRE